jgi:hypothetical protein
LYVPVDNFEKQFGLTWEAAWASGKVFNAMGGGKQLGIGAGAIAVGSLMCEVFDEKKLNAQHNYAIVSKAKILELVQGYVPEDKFEKQFGLTWKALAVAIVMLKGEIAGMQVQSSRGQG